MGQDEKYKGQSTEISNVHNGPKHAQREDFALEKSIFNNIFEKDIRRVFIYKKAERLAKAIHLIIPAFAESASLKNRIDAVAIALVDAALLPPASSRTILSRELLALSSVLSMAQSGGLLSPMNAELITREARFLLQEIAGYEEPRLFFDEAPSLADIARRTSDKRLPKASSLALRAPAGRHSPYKGHIKDSSGVSDRSDVKDRKEAIVSIIRERGSVSIKDISTLVRGVSEKTIQRELASLIGLGLIIKHGERRWSVYALA